MHAVVFETEDAAAAIVFERRGDRQHRDARFLRKRAFASVGSPGSERTATTLRENVRRNTACEIATSTGAYTAMRSSLAS
jgi:hypothetical protein